YGRRHDEPLFGSKWAQADLDGNLRPVFTKREEIEARAQGPHRRTRNVAIAMRRVLLSEPHRNEELDRTTAQLCARKAEKPLGLRVPEHDGARLVDDDHRVRR